jgi:hypothetical protein
VCDNRPTYLTIFETHSARPRLSPCPERFQVSAARGHEGARARRAGCGGRVDVQARSRSSAAAAQSSPSQALTLRSPRCFLSSRSPNTFGPGGRTRETPQSGRQVVTYPPAGGYVTTCRPDWRRPLDDLQRARPGFVRQGLRRGLEQHGWPAAFGQAPAFLAGALDFSRSLLSGWSAPSGLIPRLWRRGHSLHSRDVPHRTATVGGTRRPSARKPCDCSDRAR